MRKYGKSRLFGSLIVLSVALTFVAINLLEAKKRPKWKWQVAIPNQLMAETECENYPVPVPVPGTGTGCNLYANPHGNPDQVPDQSEFIVYTNDEYVEVDFWTDEDRETGQFLSVFSLKIENTNKDNPDEPGDYSVGFRELAFIGCRSHCYEGGDPLSTCYCYAFPNFSGSSYPECCSDCGENSNCCQECDAVCCPEYCRPPCDLPVCNPQTFCDPEFDTNCCPDGVCCSHDYNRCSSRGYTGHWVMEQFMEDNPHPSHGYDHFSLRFWVDTDIEASPLDVVGGSWAGTGYMWRMNLWNTDKTLFDTDPDYHNIVAKPGVIPLDVVVHRSGQDEWTITVDQQAKDEEYIPFWETYYQGVEKRKGKSGRTSEYRWAIGAATPFKFITKWSRSN